MITTQSLKGQEQTKEADIQKTEDGGGCVIPGEATQPNATKPLGASGNQIEQVSPSWTTSFFDESKPLIPLSELFP